MSFFSIAKGFHKLSSHPPPELTPKELDRLRAITIYKKTKDASLVCKTYGISRATLYRWLKRYDPKDLNTLRNKSRRPRRLRKPMWTYELIRRHLDILLSVSLHNMLCYASIEPQYVVVVKSLFITIL